MARSARILVPGVWYYVSHHGLPRKNLFKTPADCRQFLDLLAGLPTRFGIVIHGYALLENHYHLLIEDPERRLSEAIRLLSLRYGINFNLSRKRTGKVFYDRFNTAIVDPQDRGSQISRYLHLNPVRLGAPEKTNSRGLISKRLALLNRYQWSSYRATIGVDPAPKWLTTSAVTKKAGGPQAYRKSVEDEITEGLPTKPHDGLVMRGVIGNSTFAAMVKKSIQEQRRSKSTPPPFQGKSWNEIIRAVEKVKKEKWSKFRERHGDSGRNLVWYLCQEYGRMTLQEIREKHGDREEVVSAGLQRAKFYLKTDKAFRDVYQKAINQF